MIFWVYLGEGVVPVVIGLLLFSSLLLVLFFRERIMRHSTKLSVLIQMYWYSGSQWFTKDLRGL